jgi:hypothetical protein
VTTARAIPGYALWRVLWRPVSLFLIASIVVASAIGSGRPDWTFDNSYNLLRQTQFEHEIWQISIILAIGTGLLVGLMTREAMQSGTAWMIPRYRLRLLRPTIGIAGAFAFMVSLTVAFDISGAFAVPAFGIGALSFIVGWRLSDSAASMWLRLSGPLVLAAALLRPSYLVGVVQASPTLVTSLTLVGGSLVLADGFTDGVARRLAVQPRRAFRALHELLSRNQGVEWTEFGGLSAPTTLLGSVRAGLYESSGGVKLGRVREVLLQVVFVSVFAWFIATSPMVGVFPLFLAAFAGIQLKDSFPYPLSRRQKADAFFVASLVDAVSLTAVVAVAVLALAVLGLWRDDSGSSVRTPAEALLRLLSLFLFFPIAQMAQAPAPLIKRQRRNISIRQWIVGGVAMLAWIGAAAGAQFALDQLIGAKRILLTAIVVLGTLGTVQAFFWWMLRFYFARRDFT